MAGKYPTSPLAPASFPDLPVIGGVRFATAEAGVRYKGRRDVMLVSLDAGTTMAGVFTRSKTRSAPVLDCQEKIGLDGDGPAAIVVNSGNANAFTGKNGVTATKAVTTATAQIMGVDETRVFTSSTGVIGEPLPHDRVTAALDSLKSSLDDAKIAEAAQAIMTTDTYAKGATATADLPGGTVKIAGIAKGSGMIAPNMGTMLVYIFTDAKIARAPLQAMLGGLTDVTFNAITVDSDTSTSDTLLVAATGASGIEVPEGDTAFRDALHSVMLDLAQQVVKDGEGATKFVEIRVTGAVSDDEARTHAMSIANSPLVKTAVAGEDPNWGRIVAAIGKSGAEADRDLIAIRFGDILVACDGWVNPDYREEQGAAVMKQQEIPINVDLGLGSGEATVWTCDLTHGYISINADYRS